MIGKDFGFNNSKKIKFEEDYVKEFSKYKNIDNNTYNFDSNVNREDIN